jgi:hypothetical protein
MAEEPINPEDGVQLLRSYLLHCRCVRRGVQRIVRELEERAERHDDSKLYSDEFAGFSRINKAAREHPYGSHEYRAGLKQEKPTIEKHYRRNSHHPEFYGTDRRDVPQACPYHADDPYPAGCADCADIAGERVTVETGRYLADRMTWLDLIEMVCDWRGAYLAYGSQGTWVENIQRQQARYNGWFTAEQWWLIDQVARFVAEAPHV